MVTARWLGWVNMLQVTCDSIQSHSVLMYSGAVSRIGFNTLTPSAHRYSYCKQHHTEHIMPHAVVQRCP